jgi:hypothetical protein
MTKHTTYVCCALLSASVLLAAGCTSSGLSPGNEEDLTTFTPAVDAATTVTDAKPVCPGPNPQGCISTGCPMGKKCDSKVGCHPSSCACTTSGWACTADCGGGECVGPSIPDLAMGGCTGPNPEGCKVKGCPNGGICDTSAGCTPSSCYCDKMTGTWICTKDCGGGVCVGTTTCGGPNPQGCKQTGCPPQYTCDPTVGCRPSACTCDVSTGGWICTSDCGGGTCVPVNGCMGPNPQGCSTTGCPMGLKCDTSVGCKPTACKCDPQSMMWVCTLDCKGGVCL